MNSIYSTGQTLGFGSIISVTSRSKLHSPRDLSLLIHQQVLPKLHRIHTSHWTHIRTNVLDINDDLNHNMYLIMSICVTNNVLQQTLVNELPLHRHLESSQKTWLQR